MIESLTPQLVSYTLIMIMTVLMMAMILVLFTHQTSELNLRTNQRKLRQAIYKLKKKEKESLKDQEELERTQAALMNMMEDLTESYEKLKELDQLKSDFVINVSHELRTPLTTTRLAFELYENEKDPKKKKEMLDMIKRNVDRLYSTIHNILDFSAIDAGKLELEMKPFNVKSAIEQAIDQEMVQAEAKKLKLLTDIERLPKVKGDKEWITHVIANLIDNALKFTDKGFVKVSAKKQKGYIIVSVKDSGRGIRKDNLPRIFNKFAKLEKHIRGSGIGLWIAKNIVEQHGGEIWIKSKKGKGTTVSFSLPSVNKK